MSSLKKLKLKGLIKKKDIKDAVLNGKYIYSISPTLFPRPNYWPENLQVLGHHERSIHTDWQPTKELIDFISTSDKIVFFTFGSMTNPAPEAITKMLITVCERVGITAIFNTAAGGLVEPKQYNRSQFYFIDTVPYAWIFPKIYAVVHHGGSGTTHAALRYGCASMIIPHIIDQFAWNSIIEEKGAGPKGPSMAKLQKNNLKINLKMRFLLHTLIERKEYKDAAEKLSLLISKEEYKDDLLKSIHDGL